MITILEVWFVFKTVFIGWEFVKCRWGLFRYWNVWLVWLVWKNPWVVGCGYDFLSCFCLLRSGLWVAVSIFLMMEKSCLSLRLILVVEILSVFSWFSRFNRNKLWWSKRKLPYWFSMIGLFWRCLGLCKDWVVVLLCLEGSSFRGVWYSSSGLRFRVSRGVFILLVHLWIWVDDSFGDIVICWG